MSEKLLDIMRELDRECGITDPDVVTPPQGAPCLRCGAEAVPPGPGLQACLDCLRYLHS